MGFLSPRFSNHHDTVGLVITAITFPSASALTATSVLCVVFRSFGTGHTLNHASLINP